MTQGERLLAAIRQAPRTYGDLQALRISTCPHKRLEEAERRHMPAGERLIRTTNADGLVVFSIKRG